MSDPADETAPRERRGSLVRLHRAASRLEGKQTYLLISHAAHFLNPLVGSERARLADCEALDQPGVVEVVEDRLSRVAQPAQPPVNVAKIYFPVPLARALKDGTAFEDAASRFSYDPVHIDADQHWTWRGGPVAERTRDFLLESCYWEPELGRWAFEYKVHDGWWDKSYLSVEVSPFLLIALVDDDARGQPMGLTASGRRVPVLWQGWRLDASERLLIPGEGVGEMVANEGLRFRLLQHVDEDLTALDVDGRRVPLAVP